MNTISRSFYSASPYSAAASIRFGRRDASSRSLDTSSERSAPIQDNAPGALGEPAADPEDRHLPTVNRYMPSLDDSFQTQTPSPEEGEPEVHLNFFYHPPGGASPQRVQGMSALLERALAEEPQSSQTSDAHAAAETQGAAEDALPQVSEDLPENRPFRRFRRFQVRASGRATESPFAHGAPPFVFEGHPSDLRAETPGNGGEPEESNSQVPLLRQSGSGQARFLEVLREYQDSESEPEPDSDVSVCPQRQERPVPVNGAVVLNPGGTGFYSAFYEFT